MGANATLLNLHGGNMISSELRITASLTFPTASITCEDTARGETSTFEVPGTLLYYIVYVTFNCTMTKQCMSIESFWLIPASF